MSVIEFEDLAAGQMFMYEGKRRFLQRGVGIGQVLGLDRSRRMLFVELFGTRDEQLVPFIGFLPITYDAFVQSNPDITKTLEVPTTWEERRDLWLAKWRTGDAGVFTVKLRDAVTDTLRTVGRERDIDEGKLYVELAFPRRDAEGIFRTIEAHAVELA